MITEILSNAEIFWSLYGPAILAFIANVVTIVKIVHTMKGKDKNIAQLQEQVSDQNRLIIEQTKAIKELREQVTRVKEG